MSSGELQRFSESGQIFTEDQRTRENAGGWTWPGRWPVPGRMRDHCRLAVQSRSGGGTRVTGTGARQTRAGRGLRVSQLMRHRSMTALASLTLQKIPPWLRLRYSQPLTSPDALNPPLAERPATVVELGRHRTVALAAIVRCDQNSGRGQLILVGLQRSGPVRFTSSPSAQAFSPGYLPLNSPGSGNVGQVEASPN